MKTEPIVPARVEWRDGVPVAPDFDDVYHARAGALAQARHVFLGGNGLPGRWQGRTRFVVLETGFGLGHNFLATWAAWRADPQRCRQLVFISIEKHPLVAADLRRALATCEHAELAAELLAAWPVLTPDLHTLDFEAGQVRLLLALGDVRTWRHELLAAVDAFYLDGFAPDCNAEMWDRPLCKALARLAAPGATAATWSVARECRDGLAAAGFSVTRAPGFGGKREMSLARWPEAGEAARRLPPPPGRVSRPGVRSALVIGAGVAGAAAARALAGEGLAVTVLEQQAEPAQAGSGNPAGLFHGVVHPHDGAHAQLLRAAALRAQQLLHPLIAAGQLPGQIRGLLRGVADPAQALPRALAHLGLPPDYAQSLSRDAAQALAGVPLAGAQCLFPGGGWLSPPALVRHWLQTPGVDLLCGVAVAGLAPDPAGGWQALDAQQHTLARADVVVLANAQASTALLRDWCDADDWPLSLRRGQVTRVPQALAERAGLPRPALPLASGGYLIALPEALGGGLLCGATSQLDDPDAQLRRADHDHNLRQIDALTGSSHVWEDSDLDRLPGRVGWRLASDDRLPLVGAVPLPRTQLAGRPRLEQPRHVPRVDGLFVLTALGSRGLTLAPLLGEVLAAWVSGAPLPLPASVLDAIDPARFVSREQRRGEAARQASGSTHGRSDPA